MPIKLGELLLSNGLINEHQLKEGLHAQTVFGGRLGTNLVELGYINEMDLALLLSKQLNIPCISAGDLDGLDQDVIKTISKKLAERLRVVPIDADERSIKVAMADPTNFPAIDELRFSTGMLINPVVAPEILVVFALEKYYEVRRSVRYIRASGMAENLANTSTTAVAAKQKIGAVGEVVVGEEKIGSDQQNEEMAVEGYPIHMAVTELIKAINVGHILDVIRAFISEDFSQMAVFLLKGENAVGATHFGCKLAQDEFQEFSFPVESSELVSKIRDTKEPFMGVPTLSGVDAWVLSELGIDTEKGIICLPVMSASVMNGMIMVAKNKKGDLLDMMDSYSFFTKKVGLAFDMLIMKERILDLAGFEA
jgi:type II secretion system (T2SS) protein E